MSMASVAVRRPVTVIMFTLAVALFGLVALGRLPLTLLPDLSYPTLTVRTAYPGAAPAEVEQLINRPIEESLGTVRGIRAMTSYARAGQSDIVMEFAWGTSMDMAAIEVREKLDMVPIPLDIEKPLLLRFDPNMEPIVRLGLSASQNSATQNSVANLQQLRRFADEELKRNMESIEGVAAVRTGGGLEDEVQILINESITSQLNISPQLVSQRLHEENVNYAGGRVRSGRMEFLVRTVNQFRSLNDMRQIYITSVNGTPIQLQDIAEVRLGNKDRTSISRVNGQESIELNLYREGGANTVTVADAIRARLPELQSELPSGYELVILTDQSHFIRNAIASVKENAVYGGLLAMLVILLFLRQLKPTLIISVAIPVSVVATFFLMYSANLTLNIMSLGGIALAVGLLVDNAIVVLENISRRKADGDSSTEAAVAGTEEVSSAVTASTLTTLAVFIPLIFVSGLAGQLFIDQALTVTFALIASLVVALTLIPMLAARGKNQEPSETTALVETGLATPARPHGWRVVFWPLAWLRYAVFIGLPRVVLKLLRGACSLLVRLTVFLTRPLLNGFDKSLHALSNGQQRALGSIQRTPVPFFMLFVVITSASFLLLPHLKTQLIPPMEQREFFIDIEMPRGTPIQATDATLTQMAQQLSDLEGIATTYSVAGIGSLMQVSAKQGGDYWGRLNVVTEAQLTSEQHNALIDTVRNRIQRIPNVQTQIGFPALIDTNMALTVEVQGHDLERLRQTAARLTELLEQQPNVQDVRAGIAQGQPELSIQFDHARLAFAGMSAPEVAEVIGHKIGGAVATKYSLDDRQIDIRVRLPDSVRNNPEALRQLIINPGAEVELPLSAVADIELITGPGEISRVNQQRVAILEFAVVDGNIRNAQTELESLLANFSTPPGIELRVGGQGEVLEASYRSLLFALALAVFLVYLVMASQFESFGHPFLIMFSVPLAASGSVLGLWITQTPLSVVVFIGLIMLAGIVVNNAIVLVDRINQLRQEGVDKLGAIRQASAQRLRPILMTTLTTVLGLIPLALGLGEGAELTSAMAITVISGLLFATLLTLLFIPVVYQLFDMKSFSSAGAKHGGVSHE
ncbi:efflux RND transporter permease subunit [Aliidiomarina celeris]|uniref:efflux RND transporter permease subunit n=1 Tax=Aliidiomarina celeris TaxID=2249428 RepID=UPI000DE868C2|nr:efflux RND transporter permease subunit [Aliidiomarina celeris]